MGVVGGRTQVGMERMWRAAGDRKLVWWPHCRLLSFFFFNRAMLVSARIEYTREITK